MSDKPTYKERLEDFRATVAELKVDGERSDSGPLVDWDLTDAWETLELLIMSARDMEKFKED